MFSELKVLDGALVDAETWQIRTMGQVTDSKLPALHALRDDCQVRATVTGRCWAALGGSGPVT